MRGKTELDRRSLSKLIFRLKYMGVGTDYILLVQYILWSPETEQCSGGTAMLRKHRVRVV